MSVSALYRMRRGNSRVHNHTNGPVIDCRAQTALRWRLECAAVRILGDVASLVVDDGLDECCKLWILGIEGVVLCELPSVTLASEGHPGATYESSCLVSCVTKPLSTVSRRHACVGQISCAHS